MQELAPFVSSDRGKPLVEQPAISRRFSHIEQVKFAYPFFPWVTVVAWELNGYNCSSSLLS